MSGGSRRLFGDRIGSFRGRMRVFFVVVVFLPTVAVALVIFSLIASSERGQGDARLAARQAVAIKLSREDQIRATRAARQLAAAPSVATAVRARDVTALRALARRELRTTEATRVVFLLPGEPGVALGNAEAILPVTVRLTDRGRAAGTLRLAVSTAAGYAAKVRRVTGEAVVIRDSRGVLAAVPRAFAAVADGTTGSVEVGGERYRRASFALDGFDEPVRVTGYEPAGQTESEIARNRWLAVALLSGFVLLALIAGYAITRSLQREIETFLDAARRLGSGDFSAKVPTRGRDEFAQLGQEFNAMSGQLEARLEDLRHERIRLARSLRRLGEAFASNLDRDALLQIVVQTAVDTLGAEGGRAVLHDGAGGAPEIAAVVGDPAVAPEAVAQAERMTSERVSMIAIEHEDQYAMAYPLEAADGATGARPVIGLVVVWRRGRAFTANERELFEYLASQAAVSVENVGRHEVVAREAITDPLTGLPNRRRFDQRLQHEVDRVRSLGASIAVVMLDIDDFKQVNDTHGHRTGDAVLRGVAGILLSASRDPDTPGRLGGEEMAVVLSGATAQGAYEFAERVRERVAALRFQPEDDPDAPPFSVTASFGVAAATGAVAHAQDLLAQSDAALYEAKRSGKNRTVQAGQQGA